MKIAMIGAGYVGLVTGTCLAESGNDVTCVDIDEQKVARLKQGHIPIYEPGLAELVERNVRQGRLDFSTNMPAAVSGADLVFIAVGTPQGNDGAANLAALWSVVDDLAECLPRQAMLVIKSTVPVGTNTKTYERLKELTGHEFDVASNPEFLKEGAAIDDFMKPDRVVVGVRRQEVADVLSDLYRPFLRTERPFISMSPESAEMTKYVANALLATKISFINEVANLCGRMKADINDVRRGIGHDARIGFAFLFPGLGYGGSCFPKDVRALQAMARQWGVEPRILTAIDEVNSRQKTIMLQEIVDEFQLTVTTGRGDAEKRGRGDSDAGDSPRVPPPRVPASSVSRPAKLAIWGLSFKPRTDDIREAPALEMIDRLLELGLELHVHDPEGMENVRREYGDKLHYAETQFGPYSALEQADGLLICTEWKEYQHPDFTLMHKLMRRPVIFDGRNLYEPRRMAKQGFTYYSIGRETARPEE